jgi:hypothetical protein
MKLELNSSSSDLSRIQAELSEEQKLQAEIVSAMGQFTNNLPDYAKSDVVMFLARQINTQQHQLQLASTATDSSLSRTAEQLSQREQLQFQQRTKYFDCLHEICSKYNPVQCFSAFNSSSQFLEDILRSVFFFSSKQS